jgi:hypothetical protein
MSHSSLKTLDQVAQTICLPNERAPVRLPTYPSIDKTALFRYRYQNTVSLKDEELVSYGGSDALNIPGRKRFLLSRDPAAPLLVDTPHLLQNSWGLNPATHDGTLFIRAESVDIRITLPMKTPSTVLNSKNVIQLIIITHYPLGCLTGESGSWFHGP